MKLEEYQYLIMSLDPLHIGTGGYRLGRVDNAIVREPGTNIPKIPGTSLHGSIRSASAMRYGKPESAGQRPRGNSGKDPIIYTFGAGEDGGFSSGVVNISDAQILLFPLASQNGPVWITTYDMLKKAGFEIDRSPSSIEKAIVTSECQGINTKMIPLNWIMLEIESKIQIAPPTDWADEKILADALKHTVIVHGNIFYELVNSGLEVRTSVAINPETGTAEDKALFTYEAIPRATFLTFNIVIDDYRIENKPWPINKTAKFENKKFVDDNAGENLGETWNGPFDVLNSGCRLLEYLGIGGMSTRGFGRIKIVGKPIHKFPLSLKTQENMITIPKVSKNEG